MYLPPYTRKHLYNVLNADAYILSLDNSRIVAIDKYKRAISGPSNDHDKVMQDTINNVLDINPNGRIYIDHIRFGEAGDLTIPSYGDYIKLIPGPSYQSNGVSTITGDGSTTQFTINVKHGLLKDSIVASATVGKSSAIPSKIVTYLKDTDGDGFYETLSIEVDFNTAPASGEEIPVYWRAFIVP